MKWKTITLSALVILALDQTTKYLAQTYKPHSGILTYATNTGAAFSILQNQTIILGIIGIIAFIGMSYYAYTLKNPSLFVLLCLGVLLGGIIGNTYDRLFHGFVIDFIDLHYWPVFNIADSATILGVIGLLYDSFTH